MAKRRKPIVFNKTRLYYSIQEVAAHLGENTSTVRYWETEFDNIKPRNVRGTRQFSREDIQQVEIVQHLLREEGLTIEGARQKLRERKDDEQKRVEALHRLREVRKELGSLEAEFDRLHEFQKYSKSDKE